jgi:hypothetical protein
MPWIKAMASNPSAGFVLLSFRVYPSSIPHQGLVGIYGIMVTSTATVDIRVRRKNETGTVSYDPVWRVICPANNTIYMESDDPFVPYIGIPQAGGYEQVEVYVASAITGTVMVAIKVAGGPVDIITGSVA